MEEDKSDLIKFMVEHGGFGDKLIDKFINEKISTDDIMMMDDEELSKLVPSLRERLVIRSYCKQKGMKANLFQKLALKLSHKKEDPSGNPSVPGCASRTDLNKCSKNAEKKTRVIELGLAQYHNKLKTFKAVRSSKGGGARRLSMNKNANMAEVMHEGKKLFSVESENLNILDYQMKPLELQETVGGLYKKTKFKLLRFYVAPTSKESDQSSSEEEDGKRRKLSKDADDVLPVFDVGEEELTDEVEFGPFCKEGNVGEQDETVLITSSPLPAGFEDESLPVPFLEEVDIDQQQQVFTPTPECVKKLTIHREKVMTELIEVFMDASLVNAQIEVESVLSNGEKERGEGSGVWRDIVSAFWNEFEERCTTGKTFKVPYIRHDFGSLHWEAIGRIVVNGYQSIGYFPIFLCPVFVEHILHNTCKSSDLLDAFFKYVPEEDAQVLRQSLDDFQSADYEELMTLLDNYECRVLPTKQNIEKILEEISHKVLIQEPAFVAETWRNILKPLRNIDLKDLYDKLEPTPKKVTKLLTFPDNMNSMEDTSASHLKKFVKNLDKPELRRFLLFCTASDLICTSQISVHFSHLSGLKRRPIGHTCGSVLEIPTTYDSFPDFRAEFMAVLNSGIWLMDIV